MARATNLDKTGWFDGKDDIKHIAIVPIKIMSLDNKIDGKSVNGQKVSGLYEEFLRTVVEDDGMKFPQMANLKDSQIVENGKLTKTIKNPNYRGVTTPFWNNLTKVGNSSTFEVFGTPNCGKGEPNQVIRVGHASPVCLFENIQVFGGA